jgi:topoisomerase-4 subunit A
LHTGAEGIAVGLSTKVLPHNFNELIDASIKMKETFDLSDFMTQGIADISNYNNGLRGGRVRVRAKLHN